LLYLAVEAFQRSIGQASAVHPVQGTVPSVDDFAAGAAQFDELAYLALVFALQPKATTPLIA
jgi:hypothetical protein